MVKQMELNFSNNESNDCTYESTSTYTGVGVFDIGFYGDFSYLNVDSH